MIYLDYNATTPLDGRVLDKMMPYLRDYYGNPSAIYKIAKKPKEAIAWACDNIAELISSSPAELIFTSGGTESNNTALFGVAFSHKDKGKHIIISKIEHSAILEPAKFLEELGFKVTYIDVDNYGVIELNRLRDSICEDTVLVSVMYANNEVGTVQPIKEISDICRQHGVYFHVDAVAAVGKLDINVKELGIDLLSISAHKFYGPKGVGVLYVGEAVALSSFIRGGHQQDGRRAGTENVAGIVGLGQAAKIALEESARDSKRIVGLRDKLEEGIKKKISDVKVNGHPLKRLYNTCNIYINHVESESVLMNLDLEEICASAGSACATGNTNPSHVLLAMGISSVAARGSIRFSLGKFTKDQDIDRVLDVLPGIVKKLRQMSPL
ncbi:MAG: cysteine desulfurase family protein [Candidatus Omnitrophota bacterium]|nr:cysteine desulfurase [Candidatus Omnitrophota bacterium]